MRKLSFATNLILCGLAWTTSMSSAESSSKDSARVRPTIMGADPAKQDTFTLTSRSRLDPDFYRDAPSKSCFSLALNICLGSTSAKPPVAGPEIMKRPFK